MKIQKFKENIDYYGKPTGYHICVITDDDHNVDHSGIFETKTDLENWLLNIINSDLLELSETLGEKNQVFINLDDAIEWYQETNSAHINHLNPDMFRNITLDYGVDKLRTANKYNL